MINLGLDILTLGTSIMFRYVNVQKRIGLELRLFSLVKMRLIFINLSKLKSLIGISLTRNASHLDNSSITILDQLQIHIPMIN